VKKKFQFVGLQVFIHIKQHILIYLYFINFQTNRNIYFLLESKR